jgi:hypothetical protein
VPRSAAVRERRRAAHPGHRLIRPMRLPGLRSPRHPCGRPPECAIARAGPAGRPESPELFGESAPARRPRAPDRGAPRLRAG